MFLEAFKNILIPACDDSNEDMAFIDLSCLAASLIVDLKSKTWQDEDKVCGGKVLMQFLVNLVVRLIEPVANWNEFDMPFILTKDLTMTMTSLPLFEVVGDLSAILTGKTSTILDSAAVSPFCFF